MVKKMEKFLYLDTDSFGEDEVIVVMAENWRKAEEKMIAYLMERKDYDDDEARDVFYDCYTELTIREILK